MKIKSSLLTIILVFFFCIITTSSHADEKSPEKEILFLNSINFNFPWSKTIFWHVHDIIPQKNIELKAESLSVPSIMNVTEATAVVDNLRKKYPNPPLAVVIIGDPAWLVCRELFNDIWKDVPVILVNAMERVPATLDILLSHEPLTLENTVPSIEWQRGYNITHMTKSSFVKETIDLMYQLMPQMKKLAFISDNRYISDMARQDVKNTVETSFPNLAVEYLTSTNISTEMLLDTLRSYPTTTGLIYYSWYESLNETDNTYLLDHAKEIIPLFAQSPLFILDPEDLSKDTFAGGYFASAESYGDSLASVLQHIINGEKACNIPTSEGGEPKAYLSYPVLNAYEVSTSKCSYDIVYINKPKTFYQKYKPHIILSSIFLLMVSIAAIGYIYILRKAHSRLKAAKEKAEQANLLKTAFLANMSHEIRTPLNAIVGFSSIMHKADNAEDMLEYVNIINQNTALLLQLITDILDISKVESGTFDFSETNFDVNQIMSDVEQSIRIRLKGDDVKLIFEEKMPECFMYADKHRFIQVLSNLLTNAIKFTDKGEIKMGYRKENEGTLYFYVSDTGYGMTAEQCEHVFERFVKYNTFTQGAGLGLSICKMIVEKQGGRIGVQSTPDKGSLFWFTLPR